MIVDHTCPVAWAAAHGLLDGSPVEPSWCLSYRREVLMAGEQLDAKAAELLLWHDERLSIHYAPWDWVNTAAQVMLVGITPGLHQATEALQEVRRCLLAGLSNEESLRRADAVGSFSGPMRTNLVTMLDDVGLAAALGVPSTARLFDTHHHLAAHVSAIDFPVFVHGNNYSGSNPSLVVHPVLRSLVRACLGARVAMATDALVVPLGRAAEEAAGLLVETGLLDEQRCLSGVPHPSGANGWRTRHFVARREMLTKAVEVWSGRRSPRRW
ncbi:MAG: uracil-DNA glycosylase family protein [Acidimicrobiales bacterium]